MNADWWVAYNTSMDMSGDWYSYVYPTGWKQGIIPCLQSGLFQVPSIEVLNMAIPAGDYTFYFGIDGSPDGSLSNPLWFDCVNVSVR